MDANTRTSGQKPLQFRLLAGCVMGLALAACDPSQMPAFLQGGDAAAEGPAITAEASGRQRLVERDVEAPEVFEAKEDGLWDGRPSLGGVWVAHPDVKDPERVIIRNLKNGKFVIGALFRKERETPGPRLQISSDAAAALDILAGAPTPVHVIALRREEAVEDATPPAPQDIPAEGALDAPSTVTTGELAPVSDVAASALDEVAPPATRPAPAPAPAPKSALKKPYVQVGIFSVEKNAENTAASMRVRGLIPTVKKQETQGKTFWRVIVGPAQNSSELDTLMAQIKDAGFSDAYAVTN